MCHSHEKGVFLLSTNYRKKTPFSIAMVTYSYGDL